MEETTTRAGVAEVGLASPAPGPVTHATDLDEAVPQEFGVRFTSGHEPGTAYPQCPPPPAEVQHQMGLHQQAGE